jgi:hypothetical protein
VLVISGSNAIQPIIVSRTVNDLNASLTVQQIMLLFGMILLAGVVTWSAIGVCAVP